jgi:hypothetical protein
MPKKRHPSVLIVDDQEESSALVLALEASGIDGKLRQPEDVVIRDIEDADLVLVDYQLDTWPQRDADGISISRQPKDGLALASVLRRHVHGREKVSPTAFAILTGKIDQLASPLPPEHREHVLARINNLEWVFQKAKAGEEPRLAEQIVELANAVQKLPKEWSDGNAMRQLAKVILNFDPEEARNAQRLEDVAACIPPIHELSQWSHGLAMLRWLLHRILPYPCFLWDSYWLAARLHVDHNWLRTATNENVGLRKLLDPCRYKGVLSKFAGPRWWRSEIELMLWDKTKSQSFDSEAVWAVLKKAVRTEVKRSSPQDHPLVCVNRHYQPISEFAAMNDAVRIRPDDWPSYADQAWTTIELAKAEPGLRALVIQEDRGKVNG